MPLPQDNFSGRVVMNRDDQERLNWMLKMCHWINAHKYLLTRANLPDDIVGQGGDSSIQFGRITAVQNDGVAAIYDAISTDGTIVLKSQVPEWRPFGTAAVIEAQIGDPCVIGVYNDGNGVISSKLWAVPEEADWGSCGDEPPVPGLQFVETNVPGAQAVLSEFQQQGYSLVDELNYLQSRVRPYEIVAERKSNTVTGAGNQPFASVTIPGRLLGTGNGVSYLMRGRRTTGVGNVTLRTSYGGDVISTAAGADTGATIYWKGTIFGDGATNAQRGHAEGSRAVAPVTDVAAVDSTADQTLLIEGDLGTDADVYTVDWFEVIAL
jgi:hypothetical protein